MQKQLILVTLVILTLAALASCRKEPDVFRIDVVKYLDNSYTETFEKTLTEGLKTTGLVEGKDYRLHKRSAQGDMGTLTMLIDNAVSSNTNLLVTFQSPTLYAAIQRAPKTNIAFSLLQNPFVLGAGRSDTDHLPNLTGLYVVPPLQELLEAITECQPEIKTVGTIFSTGDADSTYRKDELEALAAKHNLRLIAQGYSTQDEIASAVEALLAQKPQGLIHLQDPAQDVLFSAMYSQASRKKIPVFSVVHNMHKLGASIVYTTDRVELGRRFAEVVAKIVKGASPALIPFTSDQSIQKRVGINRTAADAAGLTIPPRVIERVAELEQSR